MTQYCPARGDVILLDFNPQSGHEQAGKRPALVISDDMFNQVTGFAVVCPITNQSKNYPFEVPVVGAKNYRCHFGRSVQVFGLEIKTSAYH